MKNVPEVPLPSHKVQSSSPRIATLHQEKVLIKSYPKVQMSLPQGPDVPTPRSRCPYPKVQMSLPQGPDVPTPRSRCPYPKVQMSLPQGPDVPTPRSRCPYPKVQMSLPQGPDVPTPRSRCPYPKVQMSLPQDHVCHGPHPCISFVFNICIQLLFLASWIYPCKIW